MKQLAKDLIDALNDELRNGYKFGHHDEFSAFSREMSSCQDLLEIEDVYSVSTALWLLLMHFYFKDDVNIMWAERCFFFLSRGYFNAKDDAEKERYLMMLFSILSKLEYCYENLFDASLRPDRYLSGAKPIDAEERFEIFTNLRLYLLCLLEDLDCDDSLLETEIVNRYEEYLGDLLGDLYCDSPFDADIVKRYENGVRIFSIKAFPCLRELASTFNVKKSHDTFHRMYYYLTLKFNASERKIIENVFSDTPNLLFRARHAKLDSFFGEQVSEGNVDALVELETNADRLATFRVYGINQNLIPAVFTWDIIMGDLSMSEMTVTYYNRGFLKLPYEPCSFLIAFENDEMKYLQFRLISYETGEQYYLTLS